MKTIYALAQDSHEVYGHGDSGTEQVIRRQGAYGGGNFPPFFTDRAKAQEAADKSTFPKLIVVPVRLEE